MIVPNMGIIVDSNRDSEIARQSRVYIPKLQDDLLSSTDKAFNEGLNNED